jgi:hypothetical protein
MSSFTPAQQSIVNAILESDHNPNKMLIIKMLELAQERFPNIPLEVIAEIFVYAKQAYDSAK